MQNVKAEVHINGNLDGQVSEWVYAQEMSYTPDFESFTIPVSLKPTIEYVQGTLSYRGTVDRIADIRSKNYQLMRMSGHLTDGTVFILDNRTNTRPSRRNARRARKRKGR